MSILPYPIAVKAFADRLANSLLPASCLLCGADSGKELICPACHADLPPLPAQRCPLCADQTTHGERCGACLKDPPYFDVTIAAFRYDFPVDRIVHALKYGHQLAIAGWCARQLIAPLKDRAFDRLVPLPLHHERLRQRGFNQSAEIARTLAARLALPVDLDTVLRTRATPPQADLPHPERQRNVRGAFECRGDLSGQRLLLIDDVMTTAATANECARTLKLHGAASVTVAVVARALKN
ncbi:ComF family protein [Dechloromonas sp. XY25]|uniref:ComF family protein n=1 Tax=Dechloromonas hankyongensis TaxID=2908002 RepID=A0ABS9K5M0_9RHOO|nr:ComF family protein [Dechloromonas hankyongensis]MCG2578457.1 ComF family protein [Dechloromonas hankyongensis]